MLILVWTKIEEHQYSEIINKNTKEDLIKFIMSYFHSTITEYEMLSFIKGLLDSESTNKNGVVTRFEVGGYYITMQYAYV